MVTSGFVVGTNENVRMLEQSADINRNIADAENTKSRYKKLKEKCEGEKNIWKTPMIVHTLRSFFLLFSYDFLFLF